MTNLIGKLVLLGLFLWLGVNLGIALSHGLDPLTVEAWREIAISMTSQLKAASGWGEDLLRQRG